jgi:hypothetical protein
MNIKSIIAKSALWLINISLLLLGIALIIGVWNGISLFSEMDRPDSTEGMITWENRTGVNLNDYRLSRVLEYNMNREPEPFREFLLLKTPNPRISVMEDSENALVLKPRGNKVITADYSQASADLVYKISDPSIQHRVIIIYILALVIYVGIGWAWLWVFRKFILSISMGDFFNQRNIRRMIFLGIPPLVLSLFSFVLHRISHDFFISNFQILNGGISSSFKFEPLPLIFGITFLVMAVMIDEGRRMKLENDLTI